MVKWRFVDGMGEERGARSVKAGGRRQRREEGRPFFWGGDFVGCGLHGQAEGQVRRRWAMLIKRVYQVDPLVCPKCGGAMKIISFIEARQDKVIRKILEHCGLWHDPSARAPPR